MNKYTTNKKYFESNLSKNISKLDFSINIPNTQIINSFEDNSYIGFDIKSNTSSTICKHCNKSITRFKQYRITYPLYALYNSKSIMLKMRSKQYYCIKCKKHTTEKLFGIKEYARSSNKFIESMLITLREAVSYSTVSRIYKISTRYVINQFDKYSNQISINRENVKHLSIDELKFMNKNEGNYQFIIVDTYTKEVLDIISDRTKKCKKIFRI